MHSSKAKIAASLLLAASVAFAIVIFGGRGSSATLFADTLKQMQGSSYTFQMEVLDANGKIALVTVKGSVLEPGKLRLDSEGKGPGDVSSIFDNSTKKGLILFHSFKAAKPIPAPDKSAEGASGPQGILALMGGSIQNLWNLRAGDERKLDKKEIDGRTAEGFEVTRKTADFVERTTVWATGEKGLPLRVEIATEPTKNKNAGFSLVLKGFRMNPELDPNSFNTDAPKGYTLTDQVTLKELTTQAATASAKPPSGEAAKVLAAMDLWMAAKEEQAVEKLLSIDWSGDFQFGKSRYAFWLGESQVVALTDLDRSKVIDETIKQITQLRALSRKACELGRQALGAGDSTKAEKHFNAVLGLGRLLWQQDRMVIVRDVGIAVQKLALKDLTELYAKTNNADRQKSVQEGIEALDKLAAEFRKKASGG
jgi:outer membrane lipoprotein-sorting protein